MRDQIVADAIAHCESLGLRNPYKAYLCQRKTSAVRGIGWNITFAEWWDMWKPYFHLRGRGTNGLCMAREKDEGPYEIGNVYLTTNLGNMTDKRKFNQRSIDGRHTRKEERERRFARETSSYKYTKTDMLSHVTYKAHNTSKSSCNIVDDPVGF